MSDDWKSLKRHMLSADYADLDGADFSSLCASITTLGFLPSRAIVLFAGKVLDGWQRFRACLAMNVEPVFVELAEGVDPESFVGAVNDSRRHETDKDRAARSVRVKERRKAVKRRLDLGDSYRTIAKDEGVSIATIQKDAKINDGTYKENKPKFVLKLVHCAECDHLVACGQAPVEGCVECTKLRTFLKPKRVIREATEFADDRGTPIPVSLIPVFKQVPMFGEAMDALNVCAAAFKAIESGPAAKAKPIEKGLHYQRFYVTFKSARARCKAMRPSIVCEACNGGGCDMCKRLGWLTVERAEALGIDMEWRAEPCEKPEEDNGKPFEPVDQEPSF